MLQFERVTMQTIRIAALFALGALALTGCSDSSDSGPVSAVYPESGALTTGLHSIEAAGMKRDFYVQLPSDYAQLGDEKPVIIAFHGTGGSYDAWINGFYDLPDAVGDGAILVYPQALPDAAGTNQWDYAFDFEFFEKLLLRFDRGLRYDRNKLFVTGHSSGGGFAHELGCRFGDVIRGTAPVAGGLLSNMCVGSVAVIQIHGANDALVPLGVAELGRQTWVAYNGFDIDLLMATHLPECLDHSLGVGSYPVYWCLHQEGSVDDFSGHGWPSFASATMWDFFRTLPVEAPSAEAPANGGNDKVQALFDTTMSFTLRYPQSIGNVVRTAVVAFPEGTVTAGSAPVALLNVTGFDPGTTSGGAEVGYVVPIKYGALPIPGTYSIQVAVYVEGGGFPTPVAGIDHIAVRDVEILDATTPVVIDGVMDVVPVQ